MRLFLYLIVFSTLYSCAKSSIDNEMISLRENNKKYNEFLEEAEDNEYFKDIKIRTNIKCLKKYPSAILNIDRKYGYRSYWFCMANGVRDQLDVDSEYDLDVKDSDKKLLLDIANVFENYGLMIEKKISIYKRAKYIIKNGKAKDKKAPEKNLSTSNGLKDNNATKCKKAYKNKNDYISCVKAMTDYELCINEIDIKIKSFKDSVNDNLDKFCQFLEGEINGYSFKKDEGLKQCKKEIIDLESIERSELTIKCNKKIEGLSKIVNIK